MSDYIEPLVYKIQGMQQKIKINLAPPWSGLWRQSNQDHFTLNKNRSDMSQCLILVERMAPYFSYNQFDDNCNHNNPLYLISIGAEYDTVTQCDSV